MDFQLTNFCEIDPYATTSYCRIHHVDPSLNLGDITKTDPSCIQDFDLLVGGSPCTDFSCAGKQSGAIYECNDCGHAYNPLEQHYTKREECPKCHGRNLKNTQSSLIVYYLKFLREKRPKFAIYENVKNLCNATFSPVFHLFLEEVKEYGYETHFQVLNAKDYGIPQNRERIIAVFIRNDIAHGYEYPQKQDLYLTVADLLDSKVDSSYYLPQEKTKELLIPLITQKKLPPLYIEKKEEIKHVLCGASRGRTNKITGKNQQKLETNFSNSTNTITSVQKDNYLIEVYQNEKSDLFLEKFQYDELGVLPKDLSHIPLFSSLEFAYEIRKLTPKECLRLMGFSDETYERIQEIAGGKRKPVSKTQIYKQAGNSIVVDVLYWVFQSLRTQYPNEFQNLKVCSLFSGIGAFEQALSLLDHEDHLVSKQFQNFQKPIKKELLFLVGIETGRRLNDEKSYSRNYRTGYRVYDSEGCGICITANGGGLGGPSGLYITRRKDEL